MGIVNLTMQIDLSLLFRTFLKFESWYILTEAKILNLAKGRENNFSPELNRKQVRIYQSWMQDGSLLWDLSMARRNGVRDGLIYPKICMWVFHLLTALGFKGQIQASLRQGVLVVRNREYFTEGNDGKDS